MPVMDEFREEREALKNANFKTKWQYFLDYYKWPVIITVAVIGFIISFVHGILTAKDYAITGYFLNSYENTDESPAFIADLAETLNIDLEKYEIYIDATMRFERGSMDENTYMSSQKIMATMAAQDTDFLAADEDAFLYYATTDTFHDLRNIYTEEALAKYEDYLYYIDMDIVRARKEAAEDLDNLQNMDIADFDEYDHFSPEKMTDPIPIAFRIEESKALEGSYYFADGYYLLGIVANSPRLDFTMQFVDYLIGDPAAN